MSQVGDGQFKYEVIENWGRLPDGWSFGRVTGVAVDSEDRVYICQQLQNPPVVVFDSEGKYLDSWGTGVIVEPHTIYIGSDYIGSGDVIYLADRGAHVALKLSLSGEVLLELGNRGQPSDTGCTEDEGEVLRAAGPFNRPTRLFPAFFGDLYVSDGYRNSRVHRFSDDGQLIASWGEPGSGAPGKIRSPHSLWLDGNGKVYVCDRLNNRIQIFSSNGEFLTQWSGLQLPTDLHIDRHGTIYLAERPDNEGIDGWISILDEEGHRLARWSTPRGHQIWVDGHSDMYLVTGSQGSSQQGAAVKYLSPYSPFGSNK